MKSLAQIQHDLQTLSNQIIEISQELKVKSQADDHIEVDDKKIQLLSTKYSIRNKALRKDSEATKRDYFRMLSFISNYDRNADIHKLLFIQRLATGAGYNLSTEELVIKGMITSGDVFSEMIEHLEHHKYSLILDCLLIANMTGEAAVEDLKMIAEMTSLFVIKQEELAFLAKLAKCLLQQDEKAFSLLSSSDEPRWRGIFNHHIPEQWLSNTRIYCGSYTAKVHEESSFIGAAIPSFFGKMNSFSLLSRREQDSFVRTGGVIISYEENGVRKSISAKRNGFVSYHEIRKKLESEVRMQVAIQVFTVSCFHEINGE